MRDGFCSLYQNFFMGNPMWSVCVVNPESFNLLNSCWNKKVVQLWNEGRILFVGENFFYGQPYVLAMYRRVNCESFSLLAHQTKKLSNFEVRDGFCSLVRNFFTGNPMCWQCIGGSTVNEQNSSGWVFFELYTVKALRWPRTPKTKKIAFGNFFCFWSPGSASLK